MRILFIWLLILFTTAPVGAQQTYSTWSNPDGSAVADQSRMQGFVDQLNSLIDKAEQSRAADPKFLRDLRDLARGYHRPWRRQIIGDDFIDGDFTANPIWTVASGRYWVEKGWGLRSAVEPQAPQAAAKKLTGEQAAAALFGKILGQAIGNQTGTQAAPAGPAAAAIIHTAATVSNAFAVELDFSSWAAKGRLELGLYQGRLGDPARTPGYRLSYVPGGTLTLIRVSARGTGVIESTQGNFGLEDKTVHTLEWTRRPDGEMAVTVDGKKVIAAYDRGLNDPFDGFAVINSGGDYIIKRIAIYGAE